MLSATTPPGASGAIGPSPSVPALRFGHESGGSAAELAVEWKLKRNCSLAPRQLLMGYGVLCALALAVAAFWWWQGARMVMPFAGIEMLGVGIALLAYARHAADRESIVLRDGRLSVEHVSGDSLERAEFLSQWVQVRLDGGDDSLVELCGQGRRIAVGRYLRPEQRSSLAQELRIALRHSQVPRVAAQ